MTVGRSVLLEAGDELDQPHAGPGDAEGDHRERRRLVGAVGAEHLQVGAEGRAVEQRRHGELADDDGEGEEGAGEDRDQHVRQDDAGHDGEPAGAEGLGRLGEGGDVDGAQAGVDGAVHVGQREDGVAGEEQEVGAGGGAGQRQDRGGVVEADVAEDDDDRRDDQRQQGDELDEGAPARQLQADPVGGGHDDEDAEQDGEERHDDGVGEGRLEARVGEDDAVGVEAVDAAAHAQRELQRADQRHEEVDHADGEGDPGPDAAHGAEPPLRTAGVTQARRASEFLGRFRPLPDRSVLASRRGSAGLGGPEGPRSAAAWRSAAVAASLGGSGLRPPIEDVSRLWAGPLVCSIGFHASMKSLAGAGVSTFRHARRRGEGDGAIAPARGRQRARGFGYPEITRAVDAALPPAGAAGRQGSGIERGGRVTSPTARRGRASRCRGRCRCR